MTTPDGLTATYSYDGWNRLTGVTDPQGSRTYYSYYSGSTLVHTEQVASVQTTTYGYDTMGRRNYIMNALGYVTNISYDTLGRVTGVGGSGTIACSYSYDPVYGDRQYLKTSRNGGGSWDTTTWTYDGPSGLLYEKIDAASGILSYKYNSYRKPVQRTNARNIATNYSYDDGNTGNLTGISYSDGTTPQITYSYTRAGQLYQVNDPSVTGTRTFNYDPTYPLQLNGEAFDNTFYGGRIISYSHESSTAVGGSFGPYTVGTVLARLSDQNPLISS